MPIVYLTPEYHAREARREARRARWRRSLRLGCLGLMLLLGMIVGNIFFVIQNWRVWRYIDEDEAVRIGVRDAQAECTNAHVRAADCAHFKVTGIDERKDGWWISVRTADKRWQGSAWVGRRGKHDWTDGGAPPASTAQPLAPRGSGRDGS